MSLDQIVNVQISRQTTPVARASFGLGMFLGAHKRFTSRIQQYTSVQAMLDAGFSSTDSEVIAAQKYFGQELTPTSLFIGRRAADDNTTLTFTAAAQAGVVYSLTINGEVATYTSTGVETAAAVAAAFETANGAVFTAAGVTFDDTAADGTAVMAPAVASTPYSLTSEQNIVIAASYTETLTDALAAVRAENDSFYGVMCYSHQTADILEVAAAVEAMKKVYVTSSSEAAIVDTSAATDTTSVAAQLEAAAYARTALVYSAVANTQFPEAAWMGLMFPKDPGSATWKFKTLAGITRDNLSATQQTNATDKSANVYVEIGGVNITLEGTVSAGEFIDVIRGIDWLDARLTERIYSVLVNNDKVAYTDTGISQIQSQIEAQKAEGIFVGFLDDDPSVHTITVPKKADIAFNDKANRFLPNVKFKFTLAGAIHALEIQGVVTV